MIAAANVEACGKSRFWIAHPRARLPPLVFRDDTVVDKETTVATPVVKKRKNKA